MDKKVDPGWNDPPMLNYSASNPPPKSRIANKRVAFPSGGNSTVSQPNSSEVPPLPLSAPPVPISDLPPPPIAAGIHRTPSSLEKYFKNVTTKELFCDLWTKGKFPKDCEDSIRALTNYLDENDKNSAKESKEKLLSNYKDICEQWLNDINL